MDEVWETISGFDNYEISNKGNVRSWKVIGSTTGSLLQEPRLLKIYDNGKGYKVVKFRVNGRVKCFYIHRLVATHFIPNPTHLPEVNHKDECKSNNRADNLEWISHKDNLHYGSCISRISETKKKQQRTGIFSPNYGKHLIDETKQKIRFAHLGKHPSDETRKKMSESRKGEKNPMFGRHLSEETRRKISEARKGRFTGKENPFWGRHHTEETKQKISCHNKGLFAGPNNPMFGKNANSGKTEQEILRLIVVEVNP